MSAQNKSMLRRLHTIKGRIDSTELSQLLTMVGESKAADPQNADADCDRAIIFEALGHQSAACQAVAEALRIDPQHHRALELHAELCKDLDIAAGSQKPDFQDSLLSTERLGSLRDLVQYISRERIPGDVIECGVAGGGSLAVLAQWVLDLDEDDRRCVGLDTFSGMPEPDAHDTANGVHAQHTGWGQGTCSSGGKERVRMMLSSRGLGDRVDLVEGLFEQTIPELRASMKAEGRQIALLHCDADWYASTRCITQNLFDLVTPGGVVQIDDYGHWDGCRKAIDEAFAHLDPKPTLNRIDYTGRWFTMPSGYAPES